MREDLEKIKNKLEDIESVQTLTLSTIIDSQSEILSVQAKLANIKKQHAFLGEILSTVHAEIVVLDHILDGACKDED